MRFYVGNRVFVLRESHESHELQLEVACMSFQWIGCSLPMIGWLGCFFLCRELAARQKIDSDRRVSLVLASIGWGVLLVGLTELLSAGAFLSRTGVVIGWCCVDAALVGAWVHFVRRRTSPSLAFREEWRRLQSEVLSLRLGPADVRVMSLGVALLAAFLGCVAWLTPSTNWDSLTYHLPRIMHWIQQGSVEHYRTGNISQLQMGPWSAFVQTHLFLLCGSDRLANLVQWSAMFACLLVGSLLARQLWPAGEPESRRIQIFVALLIVTLPTGIVESITTQTDYTAAFWVVCFMSLALSLWRSPKNLWLLGGAAQVVGLALLTKITTVLYLAPIGVATGLWLAWRWRSPGRIVARSLMVALLMMALVLPHSLRNNRVFGWTAGSRTTKEGGQNAQLNVGVVLSNAIRNCALHTNTGILPLTQFANAILESLHAFTGRSLNDPGTTFPADSFWFREQFVIVDSHAGNPYHLALVLITLILALCRPKVNALLLLYGSLLVVSYLLFCLVLRWQMWHSRYHLPYFVAFMPLVAIITVSRYPRWAVNTIAAGLTLFAAVIIVSNQSRPVFDAAFLSKSRTGQMLFPYRPQLAEHLDAFAQDVVFSGCAVVGLKFFFDDAEYPVWTSLRQRGFRGRIESVFLDNETAVIPRSSPEPCVILAMTERPPPPEVAERFPFGLRYGRVTAFWSEEASHWAQCTYFDYSSNSLLSVPETGASIPLDRQPIYLFARVARRCALRIDAEVVSSASGEARNDSLRVASETGFSEDISIRGGKFSLAIPLSEGTTRIRASLTDQPSASQSESLRIIRWTIEARTDR